MSKTRSISFGEKVFPLMEEARKTENRDRSNFVNHRLQEHFISIGWMTPDGKVVPKAQRNKAAA